MITELIYLIQYVSDGRIQHTLLFVIVKSVSDDFFPRTTETIFTFLTRILSRYTRAIKIQTHDRFYLICSLERILVSNQFLAQLSIFKTLPGFIFHQFVPSIDAVFDFDHCRCPFTRFQLTWILPNPSYQATQ